MSDDDIRQLLSQGARAPRRRVDIAEIHRRGRRRRASVIGGGVTLALALVAAVAVSQPSPGDMVISTTPDLNAATKPQGSGRPSPEAEPPPPTEPAPQNDTTATPEEDPAEGFPPAPAAPEPSPEPKPAPAPDATDYGAPLWGRTFVAVAASEDGQPRPLVPDRHPWTTSFVYRSDLDPPQRQVGWRWGGCNSLGANVEVTPDRLRLGGIGGTAMGCSDEENEQAAWSIEFFSSDPYWRLEDGRLWLWSGDTVVELEDRTDD